MAPASRRPGDVPVEIEAKLLPRREADLDRIAALPRIGAYRLRARAHEMLHTTYVDTIGLALTRHAVALRVRHAGRRWELTAKWSGEVDGILHRRPELTVALPRRPRFPLRLPRGMLHARLAALVAGRPLVPILQSEVQRQSLDVMLPASSRVVAEIALDRVQLHAPGGGPAMRYAEVEVESRGGAQRHTHAVARLLRSRLALAPSGESKFARGMSMRHGDAWRLSRRDEPVLAAEDLATALRKIAARLLAQLRRADSDFRLDADAEAVHQMRVAVRRLHAAVRAFRPALEDEVRRSLARELRWLGRSLARLRDIDAQISLLERRRARISPRRRHTLDPYLRTLRSEHAERERRVAAALESRRYFRLLVALEELAAAPRQAPRGEPAAVRSLARRSLKRAFRRVRRRVEALGDRPGAGALQRLHVAGKRLRHLLELFADLTGKPGERMIARLIEMEDLLGSHRDALLAAMQMEEYLARARGTSAERAVLRTLAGLERRRSEKLAAAAGHTWRALAEGRGRRGYRAVRRRLLGRRA